MKILLTGACGYIGSRLGPALVAAGHEVDAVDNLSWGPEGLRAALGLPGYRFHDLDVREAGWLELVHSADAVIHLAAVVGEAACAAHERKALQVNTVSVQHLAKECPRDVPLVFANTNSGYGQRADGEPVDESAHMWPLSHYGRTKVEAEHRVLEHPSGCSLRLGTVFGTSPRMRVDLLVNDFACKAFSAATASGRPVTLYEPGFYRAVVGVNDVARAFRFAVEKRLVGPFNVASSSPTKREVAELCFRMAGAPEGKLRDGEGRDKDQRNYRVNSGRLLAAGFTFSQSLEEGIADVLTLARHHPPAHLRRMRNA